MLINVKVRYNCQKQKFESFGDDRYLIYLVSGVSDRDMMEELILLISKNLGIPPRRIALKLDKGNDKIFELF